MKFNPYQLAAEGQQIVETISRPWEEYGDAIIMVRSPGDPTTLRQCEVSQLRRVYVQCPKHRSKWVAHVCATGIDCFIKCGTCGRKYIARYGSDGHFLEFACDISLLLFVVDDQGQYVRIK